MSRSLFFYFAVIAFLTTLIPISVLSSMSYTPPPNYLTKYRSDNLGISFNYPSYWNSTIRIDNQTCLDTNLCIVSLNLQDGINFKIFTFRLNNSVVLPIQVERPACNCSRPYDFAQWTINTLKFLHGTSVSENETTLKNNQSAYQIEETTGDLKILHIWMIRGSGIGYYLRYDGSSTGFNNHIPEIKRLLGSINFTNPEKLNASSAVRKIPLQFSRSQYYFTLSDFGKPLNTKQIEEVEKSPQPIINKCVDVLKQSKNHSDNLTSGEKSQLSLCDNVALHFQDKCHDFSNLLPYCEFDIANLKLGIYSVDDYQIERISQLNCLTNIHYAPFCEDYFSNSTR